jgi:hypothetical protein
MYKATTALENTVPWILVFYCKKLMLLETSVKLKYDSHVCHSIQWSRQTMTFLQTSSGLQTMI